ncbi:MAG: hypothetical protein AAFN70_00300 [Planctomycetota bacterium]
MQVAPGTAAPGPVTYAPHNAIAVHWPPAEMTLQPSAAPVFDSFNTAAMDPLSFSTGQMQLPNLPDADTAHDWQSAAPDMRDTATRSIVQSDGIAQSNGIAQPDSGTRRLSDTPRIAYDPPRRSAAPQQPGASRSRRINAAPKRPPIPFEHPERLMGDSVNWNQYENATATLMRSTPENDALLSRYWSSLNDPQLDTLVQRGLKYNPSVRAAAWRVVQTNPSTQQLEDNQQAPLSTRVAMAELYDTQRAVSLQIVRQYIELRQAQQQQRTNRVMQFLIRNLQRRLQLLPPGQSTSTRAAIDAKVSTLLATMPQHEHVLQRSLARLSQLTASPDLAELTEQLGRAPQPSPFAGGEPLAIGVPADLPQRHPAIKLAVLRSKQAHQSGSHALTQRAAWQYQEIVQKTIADLEVAIDRFQKLTRQSVLHARALRSAESAARIASEQINDASAPSPDGESIDAEVEALLRQNQNAIAAGTDPTTLQLKKIETLLVRYSELSTAQNKQAEIAATVADAAATMYHHAGGGWGSVPIDMPASDQNDVNQPPTAPALRLPPPPEPTSLPPLTESVPPAQNQRQPAMDILPPSAPFDDLPGAVSGEVDGRDVGDGGTLLLPADLGIDDSGDDDSGDMESVLPSTETLPMPSPEIDGMNDGGGLLLPGEDELLDEDFMGSPSRAAPQSDINLRGIDDPLGPMQTPDFPKRPAPSMENSSPEERRSPLEIS